MFHVKQYFTGRFILLIGLPAGLHSIRFAEHPPHGLQYRRDALQFQPGVPQQHLVPRMLVIGRMIDPLHGPLEPRERVRQRHQEVVQREGHLLQAALVPCVGQLHEIRVRPLFQQMIERFQPGRVKERLLHLVITGANHGVDAHGLEVIAQHLLAEGVDRRYFGGLQFVQRAAEGLRIRLSFNDQAAIQALAHFRRSRLGEGHDQHAIQVVPAADQLHDALHQHRRFSRASSGADQDRVVHRVDRHQLLWRPGWHNIISLALFYHTRAVRGSVSRETFSLFRKKYLFIFLSHFIIQNALIFLHFRAYIPLKSDCSHIPIHFPVRRSPKAVSQRRTKRPGRRLFAIHRAHIYIDSNSKSSSSSSS